MMKKKACIFALLVISTFIFSSFIPLYNFNKETGIWEKGYYSLSPVAEIDAFRRFERIEDSEEGEVAFSTAQSVFPEEAEVFNIVLAQNSIAGTLVVWNDKEFLYVEFNLNPDLFMEESNVNCTVMPPDKNPVPGQFDYKTVHNPQTGHYLYEIPLISLNPPEHAWETGTELYILAHAVVNGTFNGNSLFKETAWCGDIEWDGGGKWFWYLKYEIEEPPSYICVDLSGTLSSWFVRKPGDYFANPITGSIKASHDFAITFSGFNNLVEELTGETMEIFYSFSENSPSIDQWIGALDLNLFNIDLPATEGMVFNIWQRIINDNQSTGVYSNGGVITFTLKNVQIEIVE
ncbi:MAG: hypothetical protein JW697_08020 [Kosmotogaceae bacterium]|nr:hypothetical protein [Kosmotogaceae bacterium]